MQQAAVRARQRAPQAAGPRLVGEPRQAVPARVLGRIHSATHRSAGIDSTTIQISTIGRRNYYCASTSTIVLCGPGARVAQGALAEAISRSVTWHRADRFHLWQNLADGVGRLCSVRVGELGAYSSDDASGRTPPRDPAVERSDLDALVIGNFLLRKKP